MRFPGGDRYEHQRDFDNDFGDAPVEHCQKQHPKPGWSQSLPVPIKALLHGGRHLGTPEKQLRSITPESATPRAAVPSPCRSSARSGFGFAREVEKTNARWQ
jgi:hypothetical protein